MLRRVSVARAAAFGSKVIILDEPTAALGVKESRKVLNLIQDVRSRTRRASGARRSPIFPSSSRSFEIETLLRKRFTTVEVCIGACGREARLCA